MQYVDTRVPAATAPSALGHRDGLAAGAVGHEAVEVQVGGGAGTVLGFTPRSLVRALSVSVAVLTVLHLLAMFTQYVLGYNHAKGAVPLFDFNLESNVPTWFSSVLLLLAGFVALAIAAESRLRRAGYERHWLAMGAVAIALSVDESVQLHEYVSIVLRDVLAGVTGASLLVVLLVSVVPVILVGLPFLGFLRAMARPTALGLVVAACVFLGGAAGVDTVASVAASHGAGTPVMVLLHTLEEVLEMIGVIIAIHVLLMHLLRVRAQPARVATPV